MKKNHYEAHVFDIVTLKNSIATGTNKEVVMRCAAEWARSRKTKYHWKNNIKITVDLYDSYELKNKKNVQPILTRKF